MPGGGACALFGPVLATVSAPAADFVPGAGGGGFRRSGPHGGACTDLLERGRRPEAGTPSSVGRRTLATKRGPGASVLVMVGPQPLDPSIAVARTVARNCLHHDLSKLREPGVALRTTMPQASRGWTSPDGPDRPLATKPESLAEMGDRLHWETHG